MFSKKSIAKRMIKKNAKELEGMVKKTYKNVSKNMTKRLSGMKLPIKVSISR